MNVFCGGWVDIKHKWGTSKYQSSKVLDWDISRTLTARHKTRQEQERLKMCGGNE